MIVFEEGRRTAYLASMALYRGNKLPSSCMTKIRHSIFCFLGKKFFSVPSLLQKNFEKVSQTSLIESEIFFHDTKTEGQLILE